MKKSIFEKIKGVWYFFRFYRRKKGLHFTEAFYSNLLQRNLRVQLFLPGGYYQNRSRTFPVLFFNDGQDMEAVGLASILEECYRKREIDPLVVVAIHAGDRMQEYGVAGYPDYQQRGSKAGAYSRFLTGELLPALQRRFRLSNALAIAGFSLGGLSALDIAWQHPPLFQKVGVFSGALWWRSRPFQAVDPDADRIMHELIRKGPRREKLQFWLQTGTKDETADRNHNGIIDSIDDTLDLIRELEALGYRQGTDIIYREVEGGEHNPATWGAVMPEFLRWGWGRSTMEQLPSLR